MEAFEEFLRGIDNADHRDKLEGILNSIREKYPELQEEIRWNQPMFSHEGTYIIGFSTAKEHLAVSPEKAGVDRFRKELEENGYTTTAMLFRIPWKKEVNYDLLNRIIEFQMKDKKGSETFWRKA